MTAEFVYNADGLRVQKTVNGVATKYTLHGKNIVHMTSGTDEMHFFYDAQNRPAVVVYNGTAYAYVKSLQGDVIALLDGTGNVVVSYVYDAWGMPIGKSGTLAETLGTLNPFRYRGYVFDEETGLYYLRSRYYNPGWNRFVNADALMNQNMYAYCLNSPTTSADKDGFECEYCHENHEPMQGNWGDNIPKISANGLNKSWETRIPWCQFIEWAYQMYEEEWEYAPKDKGKGIWYGHVDCSGIHRIIMYWYYGTKTTEAKGLNGSSAEGVYNNAVYAKTNAKINVIKKGRIKDTTVLVPGMGLFRKGYNDERIFTIVHVAIYVGDYFPGFSNAVIEAVDGGVVIRELSLSEELNGPYTYFGYFKGVSYD